MTFQRTLDSLKELSIFDKGNKNNKLYHPTKFTNFDNTSSENQMYVTNDKENDRIQSYRVIKPLHQKEITYQSLPKRQEVEEIQISELEITFKERQSKLIDIAKSLSSFF